MRQINNPFREMYIQIWRKFPGAFLYNAGLWSRTFCNLHMDIIDKHLRLLDPTFDVGHLSGHIQMKTHSSNIEKSFIRWSKTFLHNINEYL